MDRKCTFPDCDRVIKATGLCNAHYAQRVRHKELTPIRKTRRAVIERPCSAEGCDHYSVAKGLCPGHYAQQRRGADLIPLQPRQSRQGECEHPLCDFPITARGLCCAHYQRDRRQRTRDRQAAEDGS